MTPHDVYVSSVVISPCGHYCVLGSSHGGMYLYNLQSGLLRQTFKGHSNQVTGLFMTHLHQLVSISLDTTFGSYHFRRFHHSYFGPYF
ncbi:hypothetical protein HMI55_005627 [Coelomomyces lativittatus]|nr:hypothetical protein HMI55_005627 [Coelomomyces lativittatus]